MLTFACRGLGTLLGFKQMLETPASEAWRWAHRIREDSNEKTMDYFSLSNYFLISALPTLLMLIAFGAIRYFHAESNIRKCTLLLWLFMNLLLAVIGTYKWRLFNESSDKLLVSQLAYMSTTWLSGPLIVYTSKKSIHSGWLGIISLFCLFLSGFSFYLFAMALYFIGYGPD